MTILSKKLFDYDDENFLIHARDLFDIQILAKTLAYVNLKVAKCPTAFSEHGIGSDTLRMNSVLYELVSHVKDRKVFQGFPQYSYISYPPMIRRVRRKEDFVGWHQDLKYLKSARGLSLHATCVTMFVPLNEIEIESPILEFYDNKNLHELPHDETKQSQNSYRVPEFMLPQASIVRPKIALGDALVFGDKTLHRTSTVGTGVTERVSIEFRFVKELELVSGKDYFCTRNMTLARQG